MARYIDADCRRCRRYGEKLYLKGEKCFTPKCPFEKRPYPPGDRRFGRRRVSDRGLQLREKQRARYIYGVLERQFRRYYEEALRLPGVSGDNLLRLLEMRLDNVVYRLGWAESRDQARQIVSHGHIALNGRKTDIPSAQVKVGNVISWTARGQRSAYYRNAVDQVGSRSVPSWLALDEETFTGRVVALPQPSEIDALFNVRAIIEYYSR